MLPSDLRGLKKLRYVHLINNQIIICFLPRTLVHNNYDLIYNEDI